MFGGCFTYVCEGCFAGLKVSFNYLKVASHMRRWPSIISLSLQLFTGGFTDLKVASQIRKWFHIFEGSLHYSKTALHG